MAINNPYNNYKQNSIMTASPEELVVMMFKALEKNIRQGKQYVEDRDYENANRVILKAQDIVYELMASLDMKEEISTQLFTLYEYILNNLMEANIAKDTGILQEVLGMAAELQDSWEKALLQVRQIKYGK